jgi:hypothetical protein
MCRKAPSAQEAGAAAAVQDCRKERNSTADSVASTGGLRTPSSAALESLATATAAAAAAAAAVVPAAVTADQLKLLLELLLLLWPCPKANTSIQTLEGQAAASAQKWLLLFAALLQQAPSAAKLQLLEQRGTLLLQLLYQVTLNEDLGKCWSPAVTMDPDFYISEHISRKQAAMSLQRPAAAAMDQDQASGHASVPPAEAGSSSSVSNGTDTSSSRPDTVKHVYLVLTVLQSLMYETVPMSVVVESMPERPGRLLCLPTHGNA